MINHVYVDFGHGFSEGKHYAGGCLDNMLEVDIVDGYGRALVDELRYDGLFHTVLPTRKPPGLTEEERAQYGLQNGLLVSLHAGASAKPAAFNEGVIYIANEASRDVAEALRQVILRWGESTSKSFRQVRILKTAQPTLKRTDDCRGIMIEPFLINGTDGVILASRLTSLGRVLGRAIVSYVRSQNPKAGVLAWSLQRGHS